MTIKNIYRREDFPVDAEFMMSFRDGLLKDFLNYHSDFIEGDFVKGVPLSYITINPVSHFAASSAWKSTPIRYKHDDKQIDICDDQSDQFPTAIALTRHYGDDCPISGYSVIEANSVIHRHTGIENRSGEYIRVHIPLLIPEGDIFFEVAGEVIDWSDIFCFNNQIVHSAHNYSSARRLVYLIDIKRSRLNLPPGRPYDASSDEFDVTPFFYNGKFA